MVTSGNEPTVTTKIMVAVWWPEESSHGLPHTVETMNQAITFASELASMGYGEGKSRIHIIEITRKVTEWTPPKL